MVEENNLPTVDVKGDKVVEIDNLKERLKVMKYLSSFTNSNKKSDVKKLRKSIARELTACKNNKVAL